MSQVNASSVKAYQKRRADDIGDSSSPKKSNTVRFKTEIKSIEKQKKLKNLKKLFLFSQRLGHFGKLTFKMFRVSMWLCFCSIKFLIKKVKIFVTKKNLNYFCVIFYFYFLNDFSTVKYLILHSKF